MKSVCTECFQTFLNKKPSIVCLRLSAATSPETLESKIKMILNLKLTLIKVAIKSKLYYINTETVLRCPFEKVFTFCKDEKRNSIEARLGFDFARSSL